MPVRHLESPGFISGTIESGCLTRSWRRGASTWRAAILGLLSLAAASSSQGQESFSADTSVESDFRFAIVGDSDFKERSFLGNLSSYNFDTRDVLSIKAREGVLLRFGLEFDRYSFYTDDAPALPSRLQELNLVLGTDLQLGDAWIARVEFQPGVYGEGNALRMRALDLPVVLGASYFWSTDLQIVAGLSIDQERKYPVLPGLGFRYQASAQWVFDFVLPTPRLEYNYSKSLLLYAGGEIQSNSYRMDGNFGTTHGDPRLNNAITDYDQVRVGLGASWKLRKQVTLEMEAGFVPIQEFDFHRAEFKARATDVPPYGGVTLKFAF
jgi:hypothetical protein